MAEIRKRKLRRATIFYWALLIYIIAALVWWFISLERQNDQMREFRENQINATVDKNVSPISIAMNWMELTRSTPPTRPST